MRSALAIIYFVVLSIGCSHDQPSRQSQDGERAGVSKIAAVEKPAAVDPILPASTNELVDPPMLLSAEQLREGWITLFDGQTLFGWTSNRGSDWTVADGCIVCRGGPSSLLLTTTRFQDYELNCEVWLEKRGNSGLFLRTVPDPQNPAVDCLEFNLCDSHDSFPTGSLVARERASELVEIEGDWHQVNVVVENDSFSAEIDGETVLQTSLSEIDGNSGGHIGLQQNGGEVRFRNIFLRPINLKIEQFDEWQKVPGSEAEIAIDDGIVRLRGSGYLESRDTFDNMLVQFEAKLNVPDANSGLFFRAERGTKEAPSNGYELQLQNTIVGEDRRKPADYGEGFGTGAVFRRQKARYVNADDGEWFTVTLVADANHFSSWVNGLQVTDFTDERELDPNPRKGRRDEAGHFSLQGHDSETDASFRSFRLQRLPFGERTR